MGGWTDLERELDAWGEAGLQATFWWRDDDTVAPTAALERLLDSAGNLPVSLAVIPAKASDALPEHLQRRPTVTVLQHGFAHQNHAPAGEKKAEFGPHRPLANMLDNIRRGRHRLEMLFGSRFLPVLVPPWNRVAPNVESHLPMAGVRGLSTYGSRAPRRSESALLHINTHIDIVAWRQDRRFVGVGAALDMTLDHLRRRLERSADQEEPTGLLTHHLVHDAAAWRFLEEFVARLSRHGAAAFVGAAQAFGFPAVPGRVRRGVA